MRSIFIIFLLLSVSSCNLKPVYDTRYNSKIDMDLEAIEVASIRTIEGAEFYHRLTSILPGQGQAKYLLKAELTAAVMPATIEKNSDVSRQYINQLVKYKLVNIETGKILIEEKFYQTTSYNSVFTPYATNIERNETGIDLAHAAAEEIRNRLILYFTRNNDRPLSKLAYGREFEGDTEHSTAAYIDVREDASTGSLSQLPAEVEFGKRSNL